jgi:prepilin-type N-terminal cleavage/methylation domain-containing protein
MYTQSNNYGFTLIEVMIAIVILAIGIFSLNSMQIISLKGNSKANLITNATNLAGDRIEKLMQMDYDELVDLDVDGDGTGQDVNFDGVDDDGGNFGLDDTTGPTADGTEITDNGVYTLFWNIAVDYPVADSTTIRVYSRDNNQRIKNMIVMNYVRNNNL